MADATPVSATPRFIRRAVNIIIDECDEYGADLDPVCIAGDAIWALYGREPWSPEGHSAVIKKFPAEFKAARAYAARQVG
jgi:hypothetical protein